jgi:hypothetical protein
MVDLGKIHRIDEARFSKRQELDFVIRNRRNRLIGLWAGQRLGLSEQEAAGYATDLVGEGIVKPGDEHLLAMLRQDLAKAGVSIAATELCAQLDRFHTVAAMEFGEGGKAEAKRPSAA